MHSVMAIHSMGTTENHQDFKLGKTTKTQRRTPSATFNFEKLRYDQGITGLTPYSAPAIKSKGKGLRGVIWHLIFGKKYCSQPKKPKKIQDRFVFILSNGHTIFWSVHQIKSFCFPCKPNLIISMNFSVCWQTVSISSPAVRRHSAHGKFAGAMIILFI